MKTADHYNNKITKQTKKSSKNIMEEGSIQISIQLEGGEMAVLNLSPNNYQQSFRNFRQQHNISQRKAFKLKNLIQAKLIELSSQHSWVYLTPPKKEEEKQSTTLESPRFHKPYTDEESQTDLFFQQSMVRKIEEKSHHSSEREELDQFPLAPRINYSKGEQYLNNPFEESEREEEILRQSIPEIRQNQNQEETIPSPFSPPEKQQNIQFESKEKQIQIKHSKKIQKPTQNEIYKSFEKTDKRDQSHCKPKREKQQKKTKKIFDTSSPETKTRSKQREARYDRLYYQSTDSFRSKNNQQFDRKQLEDYMEVQKYQLSNRLKRTSPQFFYQLYKHTTQSWEHKISLSPQKSEEQESIIYKCEKSPKKVPIQKAFKGSLWKSGMRCQARQYKNKIEADLQAKRAREVLVKKRMMEQMRNRSKNGDREKSSLSLSRVCQKCSPKKKLSSIKKKKIEQSASQGNRDKKKYISNVLLETYQEAVQEIRNLHIT